jgi:hypothetical protein
VIGEKVNGEQGQCPALASQLTGELHEAFHPSQALCDKPRPRGAGGFMPDNAGLAANACLHIPAQPTQVQII